MVKSFIQAFINIFRPVYTHPYPAEPIKLPDHYRGLIEHDSETCIYCDKCEKVCPPGAILFYQHEDGTKTYRYNAWQCIYCGECVRACPKPEEALWQSEIKPRSALKEDNPNEGWFEWESSCEESREAYAEAKKSRKSEPKEEISS